REDVGGLLVATGRRQDELESLAAQPHEQRARPGKWRDAGEVIAGEKMRAPLNDAVPKLTFPPYTNGAWQEPVGAHTDERTDQVECDIAKARFAKRVQPGSGMRVIAIDERAIEVEDRDTG